MFARHVSLRLKPGKLNEFNRTFEEVLSILRRQPGFRDEINFALPGEEELIAISLWDSKEHADAYSRSAYSKVLEVVNAMLDGTPKVQNLNVINSTIQQPGGESRQPAGTEAGRAGSASAAAAGGGREMPSTTENNKEIARRFMEECWNQGNTGAMRELIADKCRYHDPAFPGVTDVQQHITSCRSAFPDLRFTIEDMIGERNEVVQHWTVRGTHRGPFLGIQPTNRQCTVSGTSISKIEGGKITEHWADWNVMTLMEQLGVAPARRAAEKV
jgi:steroid delta-isomerase-like uncharacterized protein